MNYEILPMAETHLPQVAALEAACFSDPWPLEAFRSELDNPLSQWLVAAAGDRVLGYIGSQTVIDSTDIMNLAIAADCRRNGVGGALLEALCVWLRARKVETVLLEVRKSNGPAIALYEKAGFHLAGIRPNYYFHPREDALIMQKRLETT